MRTRFNRNPATPHFLRIYNQYRWRFQPLRNRVSTGFGSLSDAVIKAHCPLYQGKVCLLGSGSNQLSHGIWLQKKRVGMISRAMRNRFMKHRVNIIWAALITLHNDTAFLKSRQQRQHHRCFSAIAASRTEQQPWRMILHLFPPCNLWEMR